MPPYRERFVERIDVQSEEANLRPHLSKSLQKPFQMKYGEDLAELYAAFLLLYSIA